MMRRLFVVLALIAVAGGTANAKRDKVSMALTVGMFRPTSSSIRSEFGGTWTRVAVKSFDKTKPTNWRFSAEAGSYRMSGTDRVWLYPITFGVERGLNASTRMQPYVTLRAGPYFGRFDNNEAETSESHTGLNLNAAYGVVIKQKFYVEARYDYFSKFSGRKFDGLSLSAGVRLFDIKL